MSTSRIVGRFPGHASRWRRRRFYATRIPPLLRDRCTQGQVDRDGVASSWEDRRQDQEARVSNVYAQLETVARVAAGLSCDGSSDGIDGTVLATGVEHSGRTDFQDAVVEPAACQS